MGAIDWSTLSQELYNVVFVIGGLIGGTGIVFTAHRRHIEHKKHIGETRAIVDKLVLTVAEQDKVLERIEKKLTMNGKNTRNPGDLLGLICDALGVEIPE